MALAACVGLLVYSGTRIYGTIGPSRAAVAADGTLYLASHGKMHVFGADGLRRQVVDLESIGAPRRPSDFDLHRDGSIVLADPDTSQLVRCAWPAGPCRRIDLGLRTLPGQEVLPLNPAKLHVDDAHARYFVSDNAGGLVVASDFDGHVIARTPPRLFSHPNQLALDASGRLTVVDTDRRRLVTLDEDLAHGVDYLYTDAPGIARPGRRLPFDALRLPNGEVAVLVAALAMRDADLIIYAANGKALRRANLGEDSDPFDIELWRGRIWVADATRYRFDSVNFDGTAGPALEDAAFLEELRGAHAAADSWKFVRQAAQAGLVLIPLFGALLLWRLGEPAEPVVRPMAVPDRVEWIEPRPAFTTRVRRIALVSSFAFLVFFVVWIARMLHGFRDYFFSALGVRTFLPIAGIMIAMSLLIFVAYRSIPRRYQGMRLGASADALHYFLPNEGWKGMRLEAGEVPWHEVFFDNTRLLAGRRLVVLAPPFFGRIFEPERLRAVVVERIPKENVLSRSDLSSKAVPILLRQVAWPMVLAIGVAVLALLARRLL